MADMADVASASARVHVETPAEGRDRPGDDNYRLTSLTQPFKSALVQRVKRQSMAVVGQL